MDPAPSTSRDRVRDGPMTYNGACRAYTETVRFVGDLRMCRANAVECAIHTILAVRQVYPPDVFVRRKRYEAPAFQSRHPGLNEYIGTTCNAIVHELQHVRLPLTQSSLRQVVIALLDEDAPGADHVLERYVFALDFLLPDTDMRNRDLMYVACSCRIKGNLSLAAAELVARQFLLQLLTLEARLLPAGERRTSTKLTQRARSACSSRWTRTRHRRPTRTRSRQPGLGHRQTASPFRRMRPTTHTRRSASSRRTRTRRCRSCIRYRCWNRGSLMYVYTLTQVSLHVEAYADVGAGASQATSHDTQEAAQSQRDLDDPDIEHGASTSVIPLRKRKLFAQPVTTGGPMSDASSAESGDESDDSGQSLSAPH